jgi:hypothetical protein
MNRLSRIAYDLGLFCRRLWQAAQALWWAVLTALYIR